MLVSWMAWKERNARVFNNVERALNQLLSDILAEGGNWIQAGATKLAGIGWPLRSSVGGSITSSWVLCSRVFIGCILVPYGPLSSVEVCVRPLWSVL